MTEKKFTKLKRFISGRSQDLLIDEAVSHIEKVNRKQKIELNLFLVNMKQKILRKRQLLNGEFL